MCTFLRTLPFLGILAIGLVCFGPTARIAQAQAGDWEYVEELGGWLDWDTGLVWGEDVRSISWTNAQNVYLPQLRAATGNPLWRMPTIAESQTAAAHGIYDVVVFPVGPGFPAWTSETKKVKGTQSAYAVYPSFGNAVLYSQKTNLLFLPVYRPIAP
jgi:hypothetical protein